MKLQIQSPLIRTVRESEPHRIPKNIFLKICLFFAVFLIMATVESVFSMIGMAGDIIPIYKEAFASGGANSSALMEKLAAATSDPKYIPLQLICTGFGTITVLLWCRFVEGRKFNTMGFTKEKAFPQYLLGLLAGFLTYSMIVGLSALFGGVEYSGFKGQFTLTLFITFIGYGIQGMSEEVLCRGYMMTSTFRHQNLWWAVGINSVIFALMHSANNGISLIAMLNLALYGVTASLYMLRTNNIWGISAFHSIWNFVQGNFYGLPVSGMDSGDTILSFSFKGTDLVNGGAFGLEASIASTIVLAVWIVCLLFVPNPFAKKADAPTQPAA